MALEAVIWKTKILGEPLIDSPLSSTIFADESSHQILDISYKGSEDQFGKIMLENAGARKKIFFDPAKTVVGIVTCGGLSPGLNNVIRGLLLCLWHRYGVRKFLGLRFGFEGCNFCTSLRTLNNSF
jgi:6-phosphofructokinase 1